MGLGLVRSPMDYAFGLDKSTLKFLEEQGILEKLEDERIKFVESKERSIDNRH